MAPHSSVLAWRIPRMEEPGRLQSMGSQRVRHDWATSLSLSFCHSIYLTHFPLMARRKINGSIIWPTLAWSELRYTVSGHQEWRHFWYLVPTLPIDSAPEGKTWEHLSTNIKGATTLLNPSNKSVKNNFSFIHQNHSGNQKWCGYDFFLIVLNIEKQRQTFCDRKEP